MVKMFLNMIGTILILLVLISRGLLVLIIGIGIFIINPIKAYRVYHNFFDKTTEINN